MVKRTVAVLGILALTLAAGTCFAFWGAWDRCGGPADCRPLFLPVDCPTPPIKTIVKTWAVKIEGPCPAPGPMCGPVCRDRGPGLCEIVTAIATPFDWLFGGIDGVYGCINGLRRLRGRSVWPVLWSLGLRTSRRADNYWLIDGWRLRHLVVIRPRTGTPRAES